MTGTELSFDSPAVCKGLGLFETLFLAGRRAIHAQAHFARLERSAAALNFPPVAEFDFNASIAQCIDALPRHDPSAALRCLYVATGNELSNPADWVLRATIAPIPETTLLRRRHGRCLTLGKEYSRSLPQHKLTSYAVCSLALQLARASAADEAFFVNMAGDILEGTTTNVFALRKHTLITAPVRAGILPGIVRGWVIDRAAGIGLALEERAPSPAEVREGAFVTGSLTTLAAVKALDGTRCNVPGDAFRELQSTYLAETGAA